jgi:hypothetical protein
MSEGHLVFCPDSLSAYFCITTGHQIDVQWITQSLPWADEIQPLEKWLLAILQFIGDSLGGDAFSLNTHCISPPQGNPEGERLKNQTGAHRWGRIQHLHLHICYNDRSEHGIALKYDLWDVHARKTPRKLADTRPIEVKCYHWIVSSWGIADSEPKKWPVIYGKLS